jgi:hypothetical protein
VEQDEKVYVEWLEKAANQNNPKAMDKLGDWFRDEDTQKALSYYRDAAELGCKNSMWYLAMMLKEGQGCEKDLRQAAIWSAQVSSDYFWDILRTVRVSYEKGTTEKMTCDFDQFCYTLGWGLYWYQYGSEKWNEFNDKGRAFGDRCLNYYCSCIELQQKSIVTFLLFWNRATSVKDMGRKIAQMVWEQREDNLLIPFDQNNGGEEPEMKRIKK